MFTLAGLAIAVSSSFCHAAKTVPFSSELGMPYGLDPEWTNSRGDGPKAWSAIKPENWEGEWATPVVALPYNMYTLLLMPMHGIYPRPLNLPAVKITLSPCGCAQNIFPNRFV